MTPNSQAKLLRAGLSPYSTQGFSSSSTDVFHPTVSDSNIPLTNSHYQQWDRRGKAVGYAADPSIIHTPKPQVANATFLPSTYPRDVEEAGNLMSKHGRQESTDVVGWHMDNQFSDPYAPESFIDNPSTSMNPYPSLQHDVQQTPTQSNFVNGPTPTNISATAHPHFDDIYGSTSSFRTAEEHDDPLYPPNPYPSSQPAFSQSPPQPRSPPPSSYTTNLR